jgi:hypothetical protein
MQRQFLVVRWVSSQSDFTISSLGREALLSKKIVKIFWWKNNKFYNEDVSLIWNDQNTTENIKNSIEKWLSILVEEKIIAPSIALDSVALSSVGSHVYISFNQVFDWSEWSIMKKWMLIESLCKTLKESGCPIKYVSFLIKNEPLDDNHLDFSQPWPIDGFLDQEGG